MGLLILLQVAFDLGFIAVVTLLLMERSRQRTQEDPRMSRGLQLLSSKIAILQDLMDRSETMGRQLTQLLDGKQQDIQERIEEVEVHLHKVQSAIEKSREVAKIFQDRIPHQEIIERQNTVKYLQAAKMANQGFSADDIAKQYDIPKGELELIIKLNRDKLIIRDDPVWLNDANSDQPLATDQVAQEVARAKGALASASRDSYKVVTANEFASQQSAEPVRSAFAASVSAAATSAAIAANAANAAANATNAQSAARQTASTAAAPSNPTAKPLGTLTLGERLAAHQAALRARAQERANGAPSLANTPPPVPAAPVAVRPAVASDPASGNEGRIRKVVFRKVTVVDNLP